MHIVDFLLGALSMLVIMETVRGLTGMLRGYREFHQTTFPELVEKIVSMRIQSAIDRHINKCHNNKEKL